ncbi:MAG: S9 family peptidase [bacterium]|nr:S9 family peptidase [bacterium]
MKNRLFILTAIILCALFNTQLYPEDNETTHQSITSWLVLGPIDIPSMDSELLANNTRLMDFHHLPIKDMLPEKGKTVTWTGGKKIKWRLPQNMNFYSENKRIIYLATYLQPSRWLQANLVVDNKDILLSAYLDGIQRAVNTSSGKLSVPLFLPHEKHLVILKIILDKGKKINLNIGLEYSNTFAKEKINVSLAPHHPVNPANILNSVVVEGVLLSPDGKRVALLIMQTPQSTQKIESWVDILNTSTGKTIHSTRNFGKINNLDWLKDSRHISYTVTKDRKTSIIKYNTDSHKQKFIQKGINDFAAYWWAPDNSFYIYAVYHSPKSSKIYKHVKDLDDRSYIAGKYSYHIHFINGVTHKICDKEHDIGLVEISPDSKKALLIKSIPDYKNRPYSKSCIYLLDIQKNSVEKLLQSNQGNTFSWAPDSKRLLILGGPSAFNGSGRSPALGKDTIPNDLDTQAYIYDLNTKKVDAISKSFKPSIESAFWNSSKYIYFRVTDESFVRIYKYSLYKKKYTRMKTGVDVVSKALHFAKHRDVAVYWGAGATTPHKLYKLNLKTNKSSLLKDYNRDSFRFVTMGKCKDLDYKTSKGRTVKGRLYFPPDFDAKKKYPCIVNFYGGTSPVGRDFAGRYPKNWYAANGYIVYVLQPTGAYGFGQEASAVHVNDWGTVTSEEIIAATKELLKTHTYIDAQRVGAIGGSYGGFLTQYLATKTSVFAAYISHAGISSISSYWGIGDWGVAYNAQAAAGSFPWNRKDLYVGHSPLYLADRITNPLLLLHGDIDNNVPPGESYQMFAALKLLGKDVSLITFTGQRHWVMQYKKRLRWMRTIIAWWDKHLKNQPQHWQRLYPK